MHPVGLALGLDVLLAQPRQRLVEFVDADGDVAVTAAELVAAPIVVEGQLELLLFLLIPGSTATTGAWPSPLSRGGWLGVQQRDDGPLERSPEMAALQGKNGRVRGSAPFGGRNGLVCLF